MTFPAALPNVTFLQDLSAAGIASKSLAYTHGTDVDLTDPASGLAPCAIGFRCTADGNFVVQLTVDSSTRTYPVTAGQFLPGAFVRVDAASTADGVLVGRG